MNTAKSYLINISRQKLSNSQKLLLRLARKYPWLTFLNLVLNFSGSLFNGVSTALIIPILIGLLSKNSVDFKGLPSALKKLFSWFDVFPEHQKPIAMIAAIVILIFMKVGSQYLGTLVSGHLNRCLSRDLRLETVKILLDVDLDFYSKNKLGDLSSRCNNDTGRVVNALRTLLDMIIKVFTIFSYLLILLWLSWQLTLITTLLLGLLAYMNQYFVKLSKKIGYIISRKAGDYTNKFLEILEGYRIIKTACTESEEYQELNERIEAMEKAQFQSQLISTAIGPINEISGILIVILIIVLGKFLFLAQLQSLLTLLLIYLALLFRLLPVVSSLNSSRSSFASAISSTEIIEDFLRRDNKPFMVKNHIPYLNLREGISFEKLSFAYPGQDKLVLKDVDLWIPKGKTIALVGSSGAGKSTMADLLARFYDPIQGRITIDGIDLKDYDLKSLRRSMGIVSQETYLFNNTVFYNIAYGLEQITEEDVITVAKRANAYEFIVKLPDGLHTEIGERGVILSGGQRQRLAIARALLRNPDILILDEATSALDTISERLVQEAIDELCRDRTTLVIAHRLSTVQKAYQIAVLDQGCIVELGNHNELLQKDGYYARLYSMQFADK